MDEKQGKIIRQNYQKNKGNIKGKVKTQIRELKELKNFPNDIDDIGAMYKWVKDNSDAIELLNNDELRSIINDKEIDAAYQQTIEIRKNVSRWIGIYDVDYLRPIKAKEEREEDLKKFAEIDNKNITQEKKNEEN